MSIAATPLCPSCGAREIRRIGALPHARFFAGRDAGGALPASGLYRCAACSLAFRHPVLGPSAYDALYGRSDTDAWPGASERADWALIEDYLARKLPTGGSVLDFGCHTGGLLQRIGSRYARTGVEISEAAARVAREKTGVEVYADIESIPAGNRFDMVAAVDVVEHFADPGRVIAALLGLVRPGGALIVTTGDADAWLWRITGPRWWYCYYPEHVAFISERWIRDLLRRTAQPARIAELRRFRHMRHPPLRYVLQAASTLIYHLAPDTFVRVRQQVNRQLGHPDQGGPPGSGLTRDHIFLALEKLA